MGQHYGSRETFGHSVIIDPWGKIIELIKDGEGFEFAEIDTRVYNQFAKISHWTIEK